MAITSRKRAPYPLCREISWMPPTFNWAAWGAEPFIKWVPFFSRGGGGFQGSHTVRLHPPALLIFTLFQSIIFKVNVREYLPTPAHPKFMSWKRTTFNSMMAWHEVLNHWAKADEMKHLPGAWIKKTFHYCFYCVCSQATWRLMITTAIINVS